MSHLPGPLARAAHYALPSRDRKEAAFTISHLILKTLKAIAWKTSAKLGPATVLRHIGKPGRFTALFVLQVAFLIAYPYLLTRGLPYLAFRVFGFFLTIFSVYAVSFRRAYFWVALVLAIPALTHRVLLPSAAARGLPLFNSVMGLLFELFIIVALFHRVFLENEPDREAIFGSLCIYLLIGFGFSNLYSILSAMQPKAFYLDPVSNPAPTPNRFDLIYYSFATLTCVGASGMAPVSMQVRSASVVENLLGVLYIAVFISRLLNAYHTRSARLNSRSDQAR